MPDPHAEIMICHARDEPGVRSVVDPMLEAWARLGTRGRVVWMDPASIRVSDPDALPRLAVIVGQAITAERLEGFHRAIARLDERGGCVLLIGGAGVSERCPFAGLSTLVSLPSATDPAGVASALHALAQRERFIDAMRGELWRADRAGLGIAGELSRWREEMHQARSMQRELLPAELPSGGGVETAVLFRPAGGVSGDFYDARWIDDRRVSFLLADAVGHGVPAALLTMIIAQCLEQTRPRSADERPPPPSQVLGALNDTLLLRQTSSRRFATAVHGVIDVVSGEGLVACAGHPPPMRISSGGAEPIDVSGPLLGVFDDAAYEDARFRLETGETLLVYSDGFETAFPRERCRAAGTSAPRAIHLEHLSDVLANTSDADQPLESGFEALTGVLDRQLGSLHQADDMTALAIRRHKSAASGQTRAA